MPLTEQITIHPTDLQSIVKYLESKSWSQGPVIIRDTGKAFQVRDESENHIVSLVKNVHEEPG